MTKESSTFGKPAAPGIVAATLGLLAAACAGEPPASSASTPSSSAPATPDTVTETAALTQDNNCLNGTVPNAMNDLRHARGHVIKYPGGGFQFLNDHAFSGCHIQGVGLFSNFGMVVDYNRVAGNNTIFAEAFGSACPEFPGSFSRSQLLLNPQMFQFTSTFEIPHPTTVFHPSGMATVGKLLFLAVDDGTDTGSPYFYVYDFSPNGGNGPPTLLQSLLLPFEGKVDSVAGSYDPATQTYHAVLNQDSQNRLIALTSVGSPSKFHLSRRMTVDNGRYPGKTHSQYNYQGMSLIRQCDGAMYLLGLTVNDYPNCSGNFDSCDDSIIDYAPYDQNNFIVSRFSSTGTLDNPCDGFLNFDICPNFAAGATAYVDSTNRLTALATEHWPQNNDLDTLVWTQP
jgi:hypothetical protein